MIKFIKQHKTTMKLLIKKIKWIFVEIAKFSP